jgi:hypothetical protein
MPGTSFHLPKKKKRKRYNAELPNVHSSPDIIGVMKRKLMPTVHWEKRNAFTVLVRKPEGKRSSLGNARCRWKY